MTRLEAINACYHGQKVRHKSWIDNNAYVIYLNGFYRYNTQGDIFNWSSYDDDQWEIYPITLIWEEAYDYMSKGGLCMTNKMQYKVMNGKLYAWMSNQYIPSTLTFNECITSKWRKL